MIKPLRRLISSAAFLVLTGLMIFAAKKWSALVFAFYPKLSRKILAFLADLTAPIPVPVWELAVCALAAWLVLINTVTFLIFGVDKLLAKHPRFRQRVPEKNLLLLAVVGGSVGALLGMYLFRHKTLHRVFRVGVPVILAVQLLLAAAITLYWNFLR